MVLPWLKNNLILCFILVFSFFVYTYKLNLLPSLYADEAVEGYEANSIWHTGADEYGQKLPLAFRLFGAYTPPLYIYLSAPIVGIFGSSPFNIRILSAISGIISVFFFYQTLKLFLKLHPIVLFSTFLYSILPWTVFNSRLGYEVMLATTLFNIGVYFLISHKHLYWALLLISLSTYTAHTQKFLAPIFLIFFLRLNFKTILFLFITQIPNLYLIFTPSFWVKTNNFSLANFLQQFVNYFSPYTLFFQPQDIDQQHLIPQIGLFFWWMIIPLIIGLQKAPKKILYWALISIVPACLSGNFISVQRALPLLVPLMLIISLGLQNFNKYLLILLSFYSLLLLYRSYFILLPQETGLAWNYGYSQLTNFIIDHPQDQIKIDNARNNGSYSLILYLLNYPPSKYQQEVNPIYRQKYYKAPLAESSHHFGQLTFSSLNWDTDSCNFDYLVGDNLSISADQAKDHHFTLIKSISTPIDQIALKIYSTPKNDKICNGKNL